MLHWSLIFFGITIVAGLLAFTGVAVKAAAGIAKILFYIALVLGVIFLVLHWLPAKLMLLTS